MLMYAHARAKSEQTGAVLRFHQWIGEQIFTLDGDPCHRPNGTEEKLSGYFQSQKDLIYTRRDFCRWFTLRPEVERALIDIGMQSEMPVAHFRRGDYVQAGFPLVSRASVDRAMEKFGIEENYDTVSDDQPTRNNFFTGDISMLPDFYRLMTAPVIFRANSTFSWCAAVLSEAEVYSPVIDGLGAGEHDVEYVEGNHPRLANFEFTTEMRLQE